MKRLSVLGLVGIVVLGAVVLAGAAVADAQTTNASNPAEGDAAFSETQFVVTVYENGSARFTQRYNQPLANETEIQRFRSYADRFESEETSIYADFKQRAAGLTAEGANATGRGMDARRFTREARVSSQPTATGVVEMSFLWTNFTASEGGRVVVGDAFENGLYLSPEMSLELRAGPSLEIDWTSVEPTPDASTNGSENTTDTVTYFGEQQFASGHPHVAFASKTSLVGGSSPLGVSVLWIAGALVLAVVVGAAVVRRSDGPIVGGADDRTGVTETEPEDGEPTATTAETTAPPSPEPAVTDADLQSDEDRVVALLEANGGRMQQGAIVEETGWSKSKVSMLLSEMVDEGRISKLRVGRENIVSLAGHEPDAVGSPFEDG